MNRTKESLCHADSFSDRIKEIELRYDVASLDYDGIPLWPFIRIPLFTEYQTKFCIGTEIHGNTQRQKPLHIWQKLLLVPSVRYVLLLIRSLFRTHIPFLIKKRKVLLFTDTAETRKTADNRVIDKIADSVQQLEPGIIPVITYVKDYTKSCFAYSIDSILLDLLISFKPFKFKRQSLHGSDLLKRIIIEQNTQLDFEAIIKYSIRSITFYKSWFSLILPERIYVNCYYSAEKLPMIYAAKQQGITVIELQHGVISRQHYAYNSFINISPNPYPTHLFCFGEKYKNLVSPCIYKPESIKTIGNNFIDIIRIQEISNKKKFNERYGRYDITSRKILVVAGTYGMNDIDKELFDFYIRFASSNDNYFIIYVPRFWQNWYDAMLPANFAIEKELSIYQCMQNADVTSSMFSTASLESLALGKPVLLVSPNNQFKTIYDDYLTSDTTMRVCNINDSLSDTSAILDELFQIPKEKIIAEGNGYYAQGHMELLRTAVQELKEQKTN